MPRKLRPTRQTRQSSMGSRRPAKLTNRGREWPRRQKTRLPELHKQHRKRPTVEGQRCRRTVSC
ncbi:hypothetical protein KP509_27G046000 [Ceratopteris richardii]|uniref:Uncharacterized protein n=1 Tax=Ceratopteris richardii TaxID=49495 RepID=A0A8T2RG71_CERRI|nr:hypothetical protein KP509_27G046000 [Ceratopteris richardii]